MDSVETILHEGIQGLPWESFLLVYIGRMRSDLVFCQAPNSLPKRFVLLIESEQVKIWIRGHIYFSDLALGSPLVYLGGPVLGVVIRRCTAPGSIRRNYNPRSLSPGWSAGLGVASSQ